MSEPRAFIDTNVLIYLLSADADKANRAEAILRAGGLISVQVLNEMTNVARRKLALSWPEIHELLELIRTFCHVASLTVQTHDKGRAVAQRYGLSVYDAMIAASALLGECEVLYSEDMQDGLVMDGQLRVCNPFMSDTGGG